MQETGLNHKGTRLFILLGGFFIASALVAEFIGSKIFSLEETLGLRPISISLLGEKGLSFNLTAGVLLWPVVFVMTDIINEYYGRKGVRLLSFLSAGLILYAFLMVFASIRLSPADFWTWRETENGRINMNDAFRNVFGQSQWIIAGSLTAFLIGQFTDVTIFHGVKKYTGERMIWLRSTGSTFVSQLVDSYIVLFIAFSIGPPHFTIARVAAIGTVNYLYKSFMAIALTPVIYLIHGWIERYLGHEEAAEMKSAAMKGK